MPKLPKISGNKSQSNGVVSRAQANLQKEASSTKGSVKTNYNVINKQLNTIKKNS